MAIEFNTRNRQVRDSEDDNNANPDGGLTNGHGFGGSNGGFSDASWDVEEFRPNDFADHFEERDGRLFHSQLFHSHGGLPYPLPVDTPEQERLKALHSVLHTLLGANFVGPVSEIMTRVPERQKYALDICTGTGTWVMEMASQFPHVRFTGFDIVPIATRYPLENVQFEMHNVNGPVRWADNTMDFVHARANDMAVINYPAMLGEAARVLRPGGLFLSGEWERVPKFANPALGNDSSIPAIHRLLNLVNTTLLARHGPGVSPVALHIPGWLAELGQFQDITAQVYFVPIGDWHPDPAKKALGNTFRNICLRYAESLKPMLMLGAPGLRLNEAQIDELVAGYVDDMHNIPGMVGVYHTVHARKV